ncbi:hypothetical protein BS50DRAFT_652520 [Corynespora cassiicola Philippines]|uniref:Uncharacterized protein n=1 Tax=Corynespora cassiicola Philippines TaxID=1448308 RepID=A0A2T2N695_CORCC|nr:hypothetical protein BS50DRAFT_652520 [Corynespora cassiicola Philippines]
MHTSNLGTPTLWDQTNSQEPARCPSQAPRKPNTRVADPDLATPPDPFSDYRTFLDKAITFGAGPYDGSASLSGSEDCPGTEDDAQAMPPLVTYNLAMRFANRSNRVPLATIIEQVSYSTLNSHASLFTSRGRPSLRVDHSLLQGPVRKPSRCDDNTLQQIQEDVCQDQDYGEYLGSHPCLDGRCGDVLICDDISASPPTSCHDQGTPTIFQRRRGRTEAENKGIKGLLSDMLRNSRINPCPPSQSSTVTGNPIAICQKRPGTNKIQPEALPPEGDFPCGSKSKGRGIQNRTNPSSSNHTTLNAPHKSGSGSDKPSDHAFSLIVKHSEHSVLERPPTGMENPRISLESLQGSRTSARIVSSETYDRAHPQYLQNSGGVPTHNSAERLSGCEKPFKECEHAGSVGRKVSICSSMSTSYSGTVLGVDLDLQESHASPRRSPTPVWFALQSSKDDEANVLPLERQPLAMNHATTPSITSSALPVLLSIAAESGIVRPIKNTSPTSFHSPSGNLIQLHDSSPLGHGGLNYFGSPTAKTSYYNNNLDESLAAYIEPSRMNACPAGPALESIAATRVSTSLIPTHPGHGHATRHGEDAYTTWQPQIDRSGTEVKGCGGLVRNNSLSPRSGNLRPPSTRPKLHRPKAALMCYRTRDEATKRPHRTRYRSLLNRLVSCCTASRMRNPSKPPKGTMLHKQLARRAAALPRRTKSSLSLGPLTGNTMRVCFCQPLDDASSCASEAGCAGGMGVAGDQHRSPQGPRDAAPAVRAVCNDQVGEKHGRFKGDCGVRVSMTVGLVSA